MTPTISVPEALASMRRTLSIRTYDAHDVKVTMTCMGDGVWEGEATVAGREVSVDVIRTIPAPDARWDWSACDGGGSNGHGTRSRRPVASMELAVAALCRHLAKR